MFLVKNLEIKLVYIKETNSINSYVIECLEKKELAWFPYDETAMDEEDNHGNS